MNRTMLTGLVTGIGIAVAGGVAGLTLLGNPGGNADPAAAATEELPVAGSTAAVAAQPAAQQQPAVQQRPAVRQQPAARQPAPAPQPVTAQNTAAEPAVSEECWDEEVEVQAEARDDKAVAGTAAGAVIGGALAKRLGKDDDLVTAAGAAAGAYLGRRAQRQYQENQTTTTTERRCAPVGTR